MKATDREEIDQSRRLIGNDCNEQCNAVTLKHSPSSALILDTIVAFTSQRLALGFGDHVKMVLIPVYDVLTSSSDEF